MQLSDHSMKPESGSSQIHPVGWRANPHLAYLLFTGASFVGAGLLFSVQPMVAKMLLPQLGGSAAVWNTAMVFFQVALLLGYAYAHFAVARLDSRWHRLTQVALLAGALLLLPIALPDGWSPPPSSSPSGWVLLALFAMVGIPFFALATLSPTLQRWLADSNHRRAANPYFLYAASNAGSMLALLAYPVLLEPLLSVEDQARWWTRAYVVLIVLVAGSAVVARPSQWGSRGNAQTKHLETDAAVRKDWRQRGFWVYGAFVPSALMLGVTRHISTDVASFPLLWIIPLALYLLTFVIAFRREPIKEVAISARVLQFAAIPAVLALGVGQELWIVFGVSLVVFFAAALLAHGRLMLARPEPMRLTEFYLWLSIGGAAGGVFAALIAPVVFDTVVEYPVAIVLALTLVPVREAPKSRRAGVPLVVALVLAAAAGVFRSSEDVQIAVLVGGAAALIAYAVFRESRAFSVIMAALVASSLVTASGTLVTERTFFGVYRVFETPDGSHVFASGTTFHGSQPNFGAPGLPVPSSYYHRSGPIAQIIVQMQQRGAVDVAVVGLGAGVLGSYARPDDRFVFYEIDPVVVDIALDPNLFTYLEQASGTLEYVVGDGRIMLEQSEDSFDLVVLDAFSSDAIPTHLLTREAIATYAARLKEGGVIALHISNRHLDLEPVLGRVAADLGFQARTIVSIPDEQASAEGAIPARWVLMAPDRADLEPFPEEAGWVATRTDASLWTDSFTSILEAVRWR